MDNPDLQFDLNWLLDSDSAIRWQAMRDLTDASPEAIAAERARVPREGLGAKILATQESDGSWRRPDTPIWLSTLFAMLLLRATGIDPTEPARTGPAVTSAIARLETNLRWSNEPWWDLRDAQSGGNPFFQGEEEPCINGGVLALGGYFGRPNDNLAHRLMSEQLDDGGWNCDAPKSKCSSFHTTICVLEGLLEYERAVGSASEIALQVAAARRKGEEYLLKRALFRRLSTGEVANPEFLQFAFPPRYHYDILRALDYLRDADAQPGAHLPKARIEDAIHLLESKRQPDGRWLLDRMYDEPLPLTLGESVGEPSRWNTLRALRVLRWYGQQAQ